MKKKKISMFEIMVGIAAIVACVAAVLVVPEFREWAGLDSSDLPETPTQDISSITLTPTQIVGTNPIATTEETNWVVSFTYVMPAGFWALGAHQYTITATCPSFPDLSGTWTHSFQVSESATSFSDPIYLRFVGLRTEPLGTGSTTVYTIHPSQPTIATYSLAGLTYTKVNQVAVDCNVYINWDENSQNSLIPNTVFQWP